MGEFDDILGGLVDSSDGDLTPRIPWESLGTDQTLTEVNTTSKNLIKQLADLYIGENLREKYPFIDAMLDAEHMSLSLLAAQLRFTKHLSEQQFKQLDTYGLEKFREIEKFLLLQQRVMELLNQFTLYIRSVPGYLKSMEAELSAMSQVRSGSVSGSDINSEDGTLLIESDEIKYRGTKGLIDDIENAMESADKKRKKIGDVTESSGIQKLSWRIAELEDDDLNKEEIEMQLKKDAEDGIIYQNDVDSDQ